MQARDDRREPATHDELAELAVAAAAVLKPDTLVKLSLLIEPDDFFTEAARNIYLAAQSIYHDDLESARGRGGKTERITLIRLIDRLSSMGALSSENGLTMRTVSEIVGNPVNMPEAAESYAGIIREYSLRRKIYALASRLEAQVLDKTASPSLVTPGVIRSLQEALNWFSGANTNRIYRSHADSVNSYLTRLEAVTEAHKTRSATNQRQMPYTGLKCLDGVTDEATGESTGRKVLLKAGSLITILADTSVGKSLLADQIAIHNATLGLKVLFFVNELSIDDMEDRRASRFAKVDVRRMWITSS